MKQPMRLSVSLLLLFVGASAFSVPSQSTQTRVVSSNLFQRQMLLQAAKSGGSPLFQSPNANRVATSKRSHARSSRWLGKIRRSAAIFCTSLLFWFGAAGLRTAPSQASTETAAAMPTAPQSRNIFSSSVDQIVDRYVKNHMFDDDVYDPVESTYREAIGDKMQGSHPRAISEITSSVLGQDGFKADKKASASGIGGVLLGGINFLQRRGVSESTAILLLAGSFVVAGPIAFVTVGMMVGNQSKRQLNNVLKKRYGDTYT
jgi:predicted PurR-regulated permease PerM